VLGTDIVVAVILAADWTTAKIVLHLDLAGLRAAQHHPLLEFESWRDDGLDGVELGFAHFVFEGAHGMVRFGQVARDVLQVFDAALVEQPCAFFVVETLFLVEQLPVAVYTGHTPTPASA
jgi:hypothetical protein